MTDEQDKAIRTQPLEKETSELFLNLQDAASFENYASANEDSFVTLTCPHCGAPIPGGASFCVSCMELLKDREDIRIRKSPARALRRAAVTVLIVLAAASLIFLGIRLFSPKKEELALPNPIEFQALLLGASDDYARLLWSPESMHLANETDDFQIFETDTAFTERPVCTGFSKDGKSIIVAFSDLRGKDRAYALKLAQTAFSAVYRFDSDDLESVLNDDANYSGVSEPDSVISDFLSASGILLPEDTQYLRSLPIGTSYYSDAPEAVVYQARSDGRLDLILLFSRGRS